MFCQRSIRGNGRLSTNVVARLAPHTAWHASTSMALMGGHKRRRSRRLLKQAVLLTRPTSARRDAPCPRQGRSERRPEASHFSPAHPKLPRQLVFRVGYVEGLNDARTKLADCFRSLLSGNVSRAIIRHSRLIGELHDIAVLDHRIFAADFFVYGDHQFSVQEKL